MAAPVSRPLSGAQAASPRPASRQAAQVAVADVRGTVVGHAWRADGSPYPQARLRLRDVQTGRPTATAVADDRGQFTFDRVPPGAYVVELLDGTEHVIAIGPLFGVSRDETVTTFVRLATKSPWFSGFFTNAATAAIAVASGLGITATGSSGLPASPQ